MEANKIKQGYVYSKNNYTVYYTPNNKSYWLSYLYNCKQFNTIKELKEYIKNN